MTARSMWAGIAAAGLVVLAACGSGTSAGGARGLEADAASASASAAAPESSAEGEVRMDEPANADQGPRRVGNCEVAPWKNCSGQDLTGGDFSWGDLRNANFAGANLTNANFEQANLFKADFSGANLTGARFDRAGLMWTIWNDGAVCAWNSVGRCIK